jgi:hypothetical protein
MPDLFLFFFFSALALESGRENMGFWIRSLERGNIGREKVVP